MVRVKNIFGGPNHELAIINLPKEDVSNELGIYIIDKTQPCCKVEIDHNNKLSLLHYNLFVKTCENTASKKFYFAYQNSLFQIEGAQAICTVNSNVFLNSDKEAYILLILTQNTIEFYSFCSENKNIYKYIGSINNSSYYCYFHSNTSDSFFVKLTLEKNYYYINFSCDSATILEKDKQLVIVRFNLHSLETYLIPDNSRAIENKNTNTSLLKLPQYYIIENSGIFDVFNFKFFNLTNMFNSLCTDYMNLFYKIFYTTTDQVFIFVSEKLIDFTKFENTRYLSEYQHGETIKGMLYHFNAHSFVSPYKNDSLWYNFFIYDAGIPHVVKRTSVDSNQNEYIIFFNNKGTNAFSKIITSTLPTFISHIYVKNSPVEKTDIIRKRIILVRVKNQFQSQLANTQEEVSSDDTILVLDNNLNCVYKNTNFAFEGVLSQGYGLISLQERLRLASIQHQNINNSFITLTQANKTNINIFHLFQGDNIILRCYQGEFGKYILVPLNEDFKIDYSLSFFNYSLFHLTTNTSLHELHRKNNNKNISFLKVVCRTTDFENKIYIVNLNPFKIFEYREFVNYAIKNFSNPLKEI